MSKLRQVPDGSPQAAVPVTFPFRNVTRENQPGASMETDLNLDFELPLGKAVNEIGIGLIGAGFIIRDCLLTAYRNAGFKVVGIASRTRERAEEVAALRGV